MAPNSFVNLVGNDKKTTSPLPGATQDHTNAIGSVLEQGIACEAVRASLLRRKMRSRPSID
jgi:hypothetical protein